MAKLSVTKDEINVTLSEREIEKILTAHVTTWLESHMDEHVDDSVVLKEWIETNIQRHHTHRGPIGGDATIVAEISFNRNNIEDEEHEIDIMD